MDWKRRYEDSLLIVLETKNEYDFLCNQHHDLILLVQLMKETLSNLERLLHTCSPEDYDVVELIRKRDNCFDFDFMVAYNNGMKGKYEFWYLGDWGDEWEEQE